MTDIILAAFSGVIVSELHHFDSVQKETENAKAYLKDRWDDILVSLICAYWLVEGGHYFWDWLELSGWHNALVGFFLYGLSGYQISKVVLNNIAPALKNLIEKYTK